MMHRARRAQNARGPPRRGARRSVGPPRPGGFGDLSWQEASGSGAWARPEVGAPWWPLLGQRPGPSPRLLRALARFGGETLVGLDVARVPLRASYEALARILTAGEWDWAKGRSGIEHVNHVFLELRTARGRSLVLEKQPVVRLEEAGQSAAFAIGERLPVPLATGAACSCGTRLGEWPRRGGATVSTLVQEAAARTGRRRFWHYDPRDSNCQTFVLDVLAAWGLLTPATARFVEQPIRRLLRPPLTRAVTTLATDAAARADGLLDSTPIGAGAGALDSTPIGAGRPAASVAQSGAGAGQEPRRARAQQRRADPEAAGRSQRHRGSASLCCAPARWERTHGSWGWRRNACSA
jgi:hypothetical protein